MVVQRIDGDLLARLPTMAARDQHDARFVLAVVSDWPDLDDEMRTITFQRLNLYTIVAAYGWPTAIASSFAMQAVPVNCLLPPGVQPVQQQQNQRQNNNQRGGRRGNQRQAAPAPSPAPAPARRGGRRRN